MKTLFCTAMLLLYLSVNTFAQNLSINDFIQLRSNDNDAIESKLTQQNFNLYDEYEVGYGKYHLIYQNNETANSTVQWIDIVYENNGQWNNRLSLQTQDIGQVKKYLTELKGLGFYFKNKKIIDRQIYEVYTNGINTVELITSQSKNAYHYDNTMYFNFAIYSSSEYDYSFANENKKYNIAVVEQNDLYASMVDLPMITAK
ncbi:MAG: hypothetical protein R2807_08825 [Chitinophagales bacterium]